MSEKLLPGKFVSELDQAEAMSGSIARMMGTYYHSLLESEIDKDLAQRLTVNFHNLFWSKALINVGRDDEGKSE